MLMPLKQNWVTGSNMRYRVSEWVSEWKKEKENTSLMDPDSMTDCPPKTKDVDY